MLSPPSGLRASSPSRRRLPGTKSTSPPSRRPADGLRLPGFCNCDPVSDAIEPARFTSSEAGGATRFQFSGHIDIGEVFS